MYETRKIEPDGWYNEAMLRTLWGIDADALEEAFAAGELPRRELGAGTYLYHGAELLAWFESKKRRAREAV